MRLQYTHYVLGMDEWEKAHEILGLVHHENHYDKFALEELGFRKHVDGTWSEYDFVKDHETNELMKWDCKLVTNDGLKLVQWLEERL